MIAYNVNLDNIGRAATVAGVAIKNLRRQGTGFAFTLALNSETWRRRSPLGRRIAAVCWHGHRAFMEALFTRAPTTRLKSTMVDYNGRLEFWARHDETGDRNIGSLMEPMAYRDACDCPMEVV